MSPLRRLILQTGISIDGYVAALDKSHPWGVESEDEDLKHWVLDSVWVRRLGPDRRGLQSRSA